MGAWNHSEEGKLRRLEYKWRSVLRTVQAHALRSVQDLAMRALC
jgi:hypothetical protein